MSTPDINASVIGSVPTPATFGLRPSYNPSALVPPIERDTLFTLSCSGSQTVTTQFFRGGSHTSTPAVSSGVFHIIGNPTNLIQYGTSIPDYDAMMAPISDNSAITSGAFGCIKAEFIVDDSAFEIPVKTGGSFSVRILINDKLAFDSVTDTIAGYPSGSTFTYVKCTAVSGRQTARVRIETAGPFYGITLASSSGTVKPAAPRSKSILLSLGDSFSRAATVGNDAVSYGGVAASLLGLECVERGSGGTGYLIGSSSGKMRFRDRYAPGPAYWNMVDADLGSGHTGTFTVTWKDANGQSQTTAPITYSATIATLYSNINTALAATFGSDAYGRQNVEAAYCSGGAVSGAVMRWIWFNRNVDAGQPTVGGLTGTLTGFSVVSQFVGDIAPIVPRDGGGNPQPFLIVLEGGYNDVALNQTSLKALAAECWNAILAAFPTATLVVMGPPAGAQSVASASYATTDANLWAQAQLTLPKINGYVPYISQWMTSYQGILQTQWTTGTGRVGATTGSGSNDVYTNTDGTHWTLSGHFNGGHRTASLLGRFLGLNL